MKCKYCFFGTNTVVAEFLLDGNVRTIEVTCVKCKGTGNLPEPIKHKVFLDGFHCIDCGWEVIKVEDSFDDPTYLEFSSLLFCANENCKNHDGERLDCYDAPDNINWVYKE